MELKRAMIPLLLCGTLAFAAAGCSRSPEDTIKIGGIAPLTGDMAFYGKSVSGGIRLAVKQTNASGGVLGREIEYVEHDDENDIKKVEDAYVKLKKKKVAAILGGITTQTAVALVMRTGKDGIPIVLPSATDAEATAYGNNVFRACFTDPYQSRTMASFACETLGAKKIAILYEFSNEYSGGITAGFGKRVEMLGAEAVEYYSYSTGDTNFSVQLAKIKKSDPEVLFVPAYHRAAVLIAAQARQMGIRAVLLGADGWDGILSAADEEQRAAVEGAYFCTHYDAQGDAPPTQDFLAEYEAEYGKQPDSFAALGYDAAMVLFAAIEKTGSTDRTKISGQLAKTEYDGVT
ncbi:MAG: ABC transporter substrate-binding protein, partial [Acetanaerobacterium sp.]